MWMLLIVGSGYEKVMYTYHHELYLCEVKEEEGRTQTSSGSYSEGQSHVTRAPHRDPNRPRALGNGLTEQNIKFWLSMCVRLLYVF